MVAKLVLDSIRAADGGKVTCVLETEQGEIRGTIEQSFFEEFFGGTPEANQPASAARTQRVVAENRSWLEAEADRQLTLGAREIVIR